MDSKAHYAASWVPSLSGTGRGTGPDWSELPTDSATVAENEKEVKMEGRTVEHSAITMSQLILPEQGGRAGFAHGGEIMKLMDTAAGTAALRHAHTDLVTARVEGINFYRPIKIWNLVTINAFLTFVGRSSMEVRVDVFCEDVIKEDKVHALSAYFIMVAVDDKGKPIEVPPLILKSKKEKDLWEKGKRRYEMCKRDLMPEDDNFKVCREEPMAFD